MTDNDAERGWRDEDRLPLAELDRAVARSANDGEVDDVTGADPGAESAFGHGAEAEPADPYQRRSSRPSRDPSTGGEPTDPQRAHRPSTTGRTGPS